MSDHLSSLMREGERGSVHDESNMYDYDMSMLETTIRAESQDQMLSSDVDTGLGASSNLNALTARDSSEARQTTIPIPPSLAGIASQVKPLDLTFEVPSEALEVTHGDTGEMGGKRKKPLAERAGWKDMDENGQMPKKARGKRGGAREQMVDSFVGSSVPDYRRVESRREDDGGMNEEAANTLARDLAEAGREMGLEQSVLAEALRQGEDQLAREQETAGGGPMDDRSGKPNSESRAEQNRRAQQVYRRRREERIKELEAQANALEPTRKALHESHQKIKAVALEYEAAKIQLSALQSTLLSLNKQGVSILTTQYNFPMDPNNLKEAETMRPGPIGVTDVEKAFEQLERQAMELAKSRRAE